MYCIPFWELLRSRPVETWCECFWLGLRHRPEQCAPFGEYPITEWGVWREDIHHDGEGGSG